MFKTKRQQLSRTPQPHVGTQKNNKIKQKRLTLITRRTQSTQSARKSAKNKANVEFGGDKDYDEYGSQSFLLQQFPTTSTKFDKKERDPTNVKKILKQPLQSQTTPTTWDFRSLFDGSFIEIETKSKTQARTATVKDEDGNVIDDIGRLASYSEGQLRQIALGLGEYKPKVAIDAKIQAKNLGKLLDTKLQNSNPFLPKSDNSSSSSRSAGSKRTPKGNTDTTVLELGDDENAWNSLKNFGTSGHLYSGFLDPIELPTHITTPPLVNLSAARVLATKLHTKAQNSLAQSVQNRQQQEHDQQDNNLSRQDKMSQQNRIAEDEAAREQALMWFAKASFNGDIESSLQLAQIFEENLSTKLGIGALEPVINIPQPENDDQNGQNVGHNNENKHNSTTVWKFHPKLKHLRPGPVFQLTPSIHSELENAYDIMTKALMPRLDGKQLQGIDYKTHHPLITTLYYYETFVAQSTEPDSLSLYCEWLFGLDEIFTQVVSAAATGSDVGRVLDIKRIMDEVRLGQRKMNSIDYFEANFEKIIENAMMKKMLKTKDNSVDSTNNDDGDGSLGDDIDNNDQDGDVYFVASSLSNDDVQSPNDDGTISPDDQSVQQHSNNDQSHHDDGDSVLTGNYFPRSDSFIGNYLQAYLKPLTLHPVHAMSAQILLDSFAKQAENEYQKM